MTEGKLKLLIMLSNKHRRPRWLVDVTDATRISKTLNIKI